MFPIQITTTNQAIAKALNIATDAIAEVQEWAKVLWVRFKGGCRFVSKKVIEVKTMIDNRIPKTLEEARAMSGVRFHTWDEKCRQLTQAYIDGGSVRQDEVFVRPHLNSASESVTAYAQEVNECRLERVISKLAALIVYH